MLTLLRNTRNLASCCVEILKPRTSRACQKARVCCCRCHHATLLQAANNYNVMGPAKASLESCARALAKELGSPENGGVRVNCLSPGPVRTMAARGITAFDQMRREAAQRAPLGRDAGIDEIAGAATFLASPLAACVTGQTIYADCGFSSVI